MRPLASSSSIPGGVPTRRSTIDLSTRRHIYTGAFIALTLLVALLDVRPSWAAPPTQISCYACLVVSDTGEILWSRNADERVAIASTTKLVTALVTRATATMADEVTVSAGAAATEGGKLSLEAGESLSVEELLLGMLLNSSNDAAVALAEHVNGSETAFVSEMNGFAADLGATDTHFVTSHGLDAAEHYSTANDLVVITERFLEDPLLASMVASAHGSITSSTRSIELTNTNELLEGYRGAIGVKTGFTSDAGNVLISAAERRGRRVIAVALGSVDHFADSRALLDFGFRRLSRETLLEEGSSLGVLFSAVSSGSEVVVGDTAKGLRDPDGVDVRVTLGTVALPVGAGDSVGTVFVTSGSATTVSLDAVASDEMTEDEGPSWAADTLGWILGVVSNVVPGEE